MKINNDYPVRSSEFNKMPRQSEIALFEDSQDKNNQVFPQVLAVNDYFIQDPRYLKSYANMFCKFIDAYKQEGIPVYMVMYQNEAYSYTPYPGCAWTPEGTIRFNVEYLAPALKEQHPDVSLIMGTINTNRFEVLDEVLSDPRMKDAVDGVGFQWEGGQILPKIREKYPNYKYVQTESECGWGSVDWKAGEHTFGLMNHYLGNGCDEYTFWNIILADEGISPWGWKQNSVIRVDSKTGIATFTPEYYAIKHYSNAIAPGSRLLQYQGRETKRPIMVFMTPANKYVVVAGNFEDKPENMVVKIGNKYLEATLAPHSFNTFQSK